MKNQEEIYAYIKEEVLNDAPEIRQNFLDHFEHEIEQFIINMSKAFLSWQNLDDQISQDRKKAYVTALVYNAINSHIISMKLFVAGYAVPSVEYPAIIPSFRGTSGDRPARQDQ